MALTNNQMAMIEYISKNDLSIDGHAVYGR